jgi:hypothetical protein
LPVALVAAFLLSPLILAFRVVSPLGSFAISLVSPLVFIMFQIGPVTSYTKMNTVLRMNVDMPWKPPDMIPATAVVMIVVAGSIIEVDAD